MYPKGDQTEGHGDKKICMGDLMLKRGPREKGRAPLLGAPWSHFQVCTLHFARGYNAEGGHTGGLAPSSLRRE